MGDPEVIGRERELEALRRALTAATTGHGQVVLVEGEAGIGKSRVLQAVVAEAEHRGFDVREGFCDDFISARPFAPLAQALRISETGDAERKAIAKLLAGDDDAPVATLTVSGKHFRVIDLLGALVEKLAEVRPLLLVVEDLHWADTATLAALPSVAQRVALLPVALVITTRPGYEGAELHRAVDALARAGASTVRLGALSADDVVALAHSVLGEAPPTDLLARLEGAAGNPLFVTEYIEALAGGADAEGVPVEFRRAVLRRVGQLSEPTNELLRVAAVLGSTFAAADLATGLGVTSVELSSRLQQAIQSGVIAGRADRLAFRHDLVRDAIYEEVPLDLRRQLHREVGAALAGADADPLAVAHHFALAAESYDEEAADWLVQAAGDVRLRAPSVAVSLLERARALLPPTSPRRDELSAQLVMPLAWAGRLKDAEDLALELLAQAPTPERAGALRCGLVYALTWQGKPRDAAAYAVVPEGEALFERDAALLAAEGAVANLFAFDFPAAAAQAAKAEAMARACGHELALCQALTAKAWVANFRGRRGEALEICREAIDIADRSENGEGHLAHPRFFPGMGLINLDRNEEALAVLQRGRQISEELGLVWALPLYHAHLGVTRFVTGDWDGAVAELTTCLTIADEHPANISVHMAAHAWLTAIYVRRDELAAAEQVVRHGQQMQSSQIVGLGLFSWAQALVAEARGDVAGALEVLEPAWAAFFHAGAIGADPWTTAALVRLLLQSGERERAAAVADVLDQADETDLAASVQALRLRCRGLVDDDLDTLLRALAEYRRSGRPVDTADTCVDVAMRLLDDGRVEEAGPYLDEALDVYEEVGAARDVARVRADLRARGVSRGTRGRRGRASTGWESLTESEQRVVALVAQRMSNPEVAERLFVSRHTVESHLKNIYRKLSIGSRGELATAAAARSDTS